jgi:glyceraldehyde 3-phosphate dehydrogenase
MKNIIGVNGFGRIGRCFTRIALQNNDFEIALINDLAEINTLAHLLKYDSIHGKLNLGFEILENSLVFENGKKIIFSQEKEPSNIKWKDFNVNTVIESTGLFLTKEKANLHLLGGAKKVILSAPGNDKDIKTIVFGINEHELLNTDTIISNASCTTNSAAPLIKVINSLSQIESAYLTTVHSYTSDQRLHDAPHKDLRRARAAALNIVPSSTGAAKALWKIFPELVGKIDGTAMRVPVPDGSLTDLTIIVKDNLTKEEINAAYLKASQNELNGILEFSNEPLVSSDIVGNSSSVVFDSDLTNVIGKMVKIVGWYDNEYGYSSRLVDLVKIWN